MNTQFRATLSGCVAIILWGCLAFLTDINRQIPPFQLMTMSFATGFAVIALKWKLTGQNAMALFKQPRSTWVLTLFGLFGYHFFYFMALRFAPVAQAGLVAYLWPLFIVLLATRLLNQPVKLLLVVGAIISLLGCWLLIYRPDMQLSTQHIWGYCFAIACALIWSLYSVLSSKRTQVPSDFIGWGCGVTALLALVCHLVLEQTLWPLSSSQWVGILLLGAGPVGIAFVAWDHGMKKGNLPLLGSLSYLAPLLSTVILIVWADVQVTGQLVLGGAMILGGAIMAAKVSKQPKTDG